MSTKKDKPNDGISQPDSTDQQQQEQEPEPQPTEQNQQQEQQQERQEQEEQQPPHPSISPTPPAPTLPTPIYQYPYQGRRIASTISQIYHEKQSQQHCAVHSINNILQYPAYTDSQFDIIAKEMSPDSWINPHKSLFGTGNYDANVLLYALSIKSGLETTWYNRQKRLSLERLNITKLAGIIVNIITSSFLWWEQRHWIPLVPVVSGGSSGGSSSTGTAATTTQKNENFDQSYIVSTTTTTTATTTPPHPNNTVSTTNQSSSSTPSSSSSIITPLWFNLNPLLNNPQKIIVSQYLENTIKKDKDTIIIFVLLPGVQSEDIWLPE